MSVNQYKEGKLIKIAGNAIGGDTKDSIVTFDSGDNLTPVSPTDVPLITSGEEHSSLFTKLSTMAKNTRYLLKMLGTTDISAIGGGTVTGAISALNTGLDVVNSNLYTHYLPVIVHKWGNQDKPRRITFSGNFVTRECAGFLILAGQGGPLLPIPIGFAGITTGINPIIECIANDPNNLVIVNGTSIDIPYHSSGWGIDTLILFDYGYTNAQVTITAIT